MAGVGQWFTFQLLKFRTSGCRICASPADGDFHGVAPEADLRIADAADGAVFPFGQRGGEREGVGVVRRGVEGCE